MELVVKKALRGTPKITITISKLVRNKISRAHGRPITPGYPVQVLGSKQRSPRNLIVIKMKKDDPYIKSSKIVRIDSVSRARLGVREGSTVDVLPLKFETWYHGTSIHDPMIIVRDGWIVGPGEALGPGIYLTNKKSIAQGYAQTGLITCEVAWGKKLNWPNLSPDLKKKFELWCQEHGLNHEELLRVRPPWNDSNILRWARLYGHYYDGGSYMGEIRVFPGPIGSGFKPNRLRIVNVLCKDGRRVIWDRGSQQR